MQLLIKEILLLLIQLILHIILSIIAIYLIIKPFIMLLNTEIKPNMLTCEKIEELIRKKEQEEINRKIQDNLNELEKLFGKDKD